MEFTCTKELCRFCIRFLRSLLPTRLIMPSPFGRPGPVLREGVSTSLHRVNTPERLHQNTQKIHTMRVNWSEFTLDLLQVYSPWRRSRGRTPLPTSMYLIVLKTQSNVNSQAKKFEETSISIHSSESRTASNRFPSSGRRLQRGSPMTEREWL